MVRGGGAVRRRGAEAQREGAAPGRVARPPQLLSMGTCCGLGQERIHLPTLPDAPPGLQPRKCSRQETLLGL